MFTFSLGEKLKAGKVQTVPVWFYSLLGVIIISIIFPYVVTSNYFAGIAVNIMIYALVALGLQLIMGYSGQISLGQAAFLGVGAYIAAILLKSGVPFWFVLPLSGLGAGIMGFIMSPIVRLKGVYFAISTLAFNIILSNVFSSWDAVTQGVKGIMAIPKPSIGGLMITTPQQFFVLGLIILWICFVVSRQITHSGYGRTLRSIRDNDIAALSSGINTTGHKMQIIFVGCFFAGMAGALMASYRGFVSPEPFAMVQSFFMVSMLIVGGMGNLFGAVIGAVTMTIVSEYLSVFAGTHRVLVYGVVLLFFVLVLPKGIMGIFEWLYFKVISLGGKK